MPGPAETAAIALGVDHKIVTHGPVRSAAEAAAAQGVPVHDLVKTIVVRRAAGDYVFVLVPGDRQISWPKLRALLGVNRLSLPDAATAKEATGYERGTITPFGSARPWPVIADETSRGRTISLGAGERGVGLRVSADAAVAALGGRFADVTEATAA
ncbi:aminoacyl-tRNA deacylase [Paractinoplanes rhizophilus]|jgi:Cys-tRNA(Pro) deacylase|uniref:Aminoacyl-tRNA deacylase n=1 Tax=Paractinoplanes rhizophilus TaxID=1416877 RepID=A0ABW2HNR0_9ACTN|nr:YbaK/EbsC family protein [Actinoplanes sp.]